MTIPTTIKGKKKELVTFLKDLISDEQKAGSEYTVAMLKVSIKEVYGEAILKEANS